MFLLYLIIFSLFIGSSILVSAAYNPELSGDFEVGDRLYTDQVMEEKEILDKYYYKRCWIKYKKKLAPGEYYYLKGQFYKKEYDQKDSYNNIALDFWGNYTSQLSDQLKRRWKLNYKDKVYYTNRTKSYNTYKIEYQLYYKYDKKSDYSLSLQQQWNDYKNEDSKDSTRNKLGLNWKCDISDSFEISTSYQVEKQLYNGTSGSSDKYGRKLSLGFKYKL